MSLWATIRLSGRRAGGTLALVAVFIFSGRSAAAQTVALTDFARMHSIFAMAGLAEAAFFYGLLMVAAILSVVLGLLGLAWWKRWPAAGVIACVICLIAGFLLQPWSAFRAPEYPNDPDEIYWLTRWRVASVIWAVILLAAIACVGSIIRRQRFLSDAPNVG